MTVGERIQKRRKELGYSVEYLADLLGKNRATVYRYENGDIENLPISILEPIARVLNTTPGALMGWEDDNSQNDKYEVNTIAAHHDDYEFTKEELAEIEQFKEFIRMRKRQKEEENQK